MSPSPFYWKCCFHKLMYEFTTSLTWISPYQTLKKKPGDEPATGLCNRPKKAEQPYLTSLNPD